MANNIEDRYPNCSMTGLGLLFNIDQTILCEVLGFYSQNSLAVLEAFCIYNVKTICQCQYYAIPQNPDTRGAPSNPKHKVILIFYHCLFVREQTA